MKKDIPSELNRAPVEVRCMRLSTLTGAKSLEHRYRIRRPRLADVDVNLLGSGVGGVVIAPF